eukprot:768741-Hanusia_phi.AAC.11
MARTLRFGAKVSLFAEEMKGFVVGDGFVQQEVQVECLREDEHNIPEFEVRQRPPSPLLLTDTRSELCSRCFQDKNAMPHGS